MKGKIIAKVKPEKLDMETKDQWVSYDGETMEQFRDRMKEGGSDPNNFNFTDPIENNQNTQEYVPLVDVPKSVNLDLSIIYYARELGLITDQEFASLKPFLLAGVRGHIGTIPVTSETMEVAEKENIDKLEQEQKNLEEIIDVKEPDNVEEMQEQEDLLQTGEDKPVEEQE
jgi:hypothetical protein